MRPKLGTPIASCDLLLLRRLKKRLQYTARRINSRSIRPNGRDVRAMGLSQNSARKSPTAQSKRKRKRKRKLMRSGGISDEDALNRPFPFTLGVNTYVKVPPNARDAQPRSHPGFGTYLPAHGQLYLHYPRASHVDATHKGACCQSSPT